MTEAVINNIQFISVVGECSAQSLKHIHFDDNFYKRFLDIYLPIFEDDKSVNIIVYQLNEAFRRTFVVPEHMYLYDINPLFSQYPIEYKSYVRGLAKQTSIFYRLISDFLHFFLFYFTHIILVHPLVILYFTYLYFYRYNLFWKYIKKIAFFIFVMFILPIAYLNGFYFFEYPFMFYFQLSAGLKATGTDLDYIVYLYEKLLSLDYAVRWLFLSNDSHNIYTLLCTIHIVLDPFMYYDIMKIILPDHFYYINIIGGNNYFFKLGY